SFSKAATCFSTIFFSAGLEKAPPRVIVTGPPSPEAPSLPPPHPANTKEIATTKLIQDIQRRIRICIPPWGVSDGRRRRGHPAGNALPVRMLLSGRPGYVNPRPKAKGFHRVQGWITTSPPVVLVSTQVRVASPSRTRQSSSRP